MRASRRLVWKLYVIVLLAVYSQPSFSDEKNCPADAGSSETGKRREAAEVIGDGGGGVIPQGGGVIPQGGGVIPQGGGVNPQGGGLIPQGGGVIPQGPEMNWPGKWELFLKSSGVSAMHAILLPLINKVQFYDATIWRISQIKLPPGVPCNVYDKNTMATDCWAHSVLIDIDTGNIRPLALSTDTWCSSGGLTINGTLVSTGGFQGGGKTARYLSNCENCGWVEYPTALAARRWYSTQATLPDGTFIVVGGRDALNYEYILPEGIDNKKLYDSQLLKETDDPTENNLYPFVWLNTDGNLFMFANNRSILLSPKTNKVLREYPQLPGGTRNYPGSASSALLPIRLGIQNPTVIPADVIICGGAKQDAFNLAETKKIYDPALKDCQRISLNTPNPVWITEAMPMPRVMSDAVLLPNADLIIINGVKRGTSGWGNGREPLFAPIMYSPDKPLGKRFKELAPSSIPRVYHSIALALPDGKVLVGGSNTNDGYKYDVMFPTELRLQKYSPPYLDPAFANMRPTIVKTAMPKQIRYGQRFSIKIQLNQNTVANENVMVTMLAPPFTTHSVSMNMRVVSLGIFDIKKEVSDLHQINALAPPSGNITPPGYYLLFVVYNGVPSVGEWIQIV